MITKKYIKEHFSNISIDTPLYNSDYDSVTIIKYLDGLISTNVLDPIVYIDETGIADYNYQMTTKEIIPLKLQDLFNATENWNEHTMLERDVEDGYVFSNYKHWLYYKDKLIFY